MALTKHFLAFGQGVIILLIVAGAVSAAPREFDVEAPYGFVGPIALKDGRLFAIDRMTMNRLFSTDAGRTWNQGGPLLGSNGRPVLGRKEQRGHLPSLVRLADGVIALKYNLPQTESNADGSKYDAFLVRSRNEATSWSAPVLITPPRSRSNATWLIQTRKGRLLLPNEYWFTQPGDRGIGICSALYSDNAGRTWSESRGGLWIWDRGGAGQGSCEVPTAVESADGKLLMFMRTSHQRIASSVSKDGGRSWSAARLTDLVSSNSEIFLVRVPNTNDLLCVWNQADTQEINSGYYRARLTAAISKDAGASWGRFRTIRQSPGQKQVSRIAATGAPAYLRTPRAIPTEEQLLASEFHMNRAPRIHFVKDFAYLRYTHRKYKYVDGKVKRFTDQTRLRAIPTGWFYANDAGAKPRP